MKKIIFNMLLLFVITASAVAQSVDPVPMANTPANQPENNAYFNAIQNPFYTEMYKSYWVWDKASATWVKLIELVGAPPPIINTGVYRGIDNSNNTNNNNAGTVKPRTKPGGQ